MDDDLPTLTSTAYGRADAAALWSEPRADFRIRRAVFPYHQPLDPAELVRRLHPQVMPAIPSPVASKEKIPVTTKVAELAPTCRLVKIFVVDPDPNVPLESRLLYQSDERLTDSTDEELLYEVDLRSILDRHNEARKTTRDKSVKSKEVFLEPIRIRDLRMTVVTFAEFRPVS